MISEGTKELARIASRDAVSAAHRFREAFGRGLDDLNPKWRTIPTKEFSRLFEDVRDEIRVIATDKATGISYDLFKRYASVAERCLRFGVGWATSRDVPIGQLMRAMAHIKRQGFDIQRGNDNDALFEAAIREMRDADVAAARRRPKPEPQPARKTFPDPKDYHRDGEFNAEAFTAAFLSKLKEYLEHPDLESLRVAKTNPIHPILRTCQKFIKPEAEPVRPPRKEANEERHAQPVGSP